MKKVALIRGKFLNAFDMQVYEQMSPTFALTAFGSWFPFHGTFSFPTIKLLSPMDLPNFPYKMAVLNRLFIDAQYLVGLEEHLKGFEIAHTTETYYGYTQQAITAKEKGYVKKVVCTVWENIPFNNEGIWGRKKYKKRAFNLVDHFIAVSNAAKDALVKEGISKDRITIINHGIDTKRFVPARKMNDKVKNILFIGRLEKEKGIYELFLAFSLMVKKYPDITLTVIGEGSEKDRLRTFADESGMLNNIIWKVVTYTNLPSEYQKADMFIAPSKSTKYWKEQFGMVLAEALSSGLPVITTKSGSIPSTVGDAAMLIPENDSGALIKAIENLITDVSLRNEYRIKARKHAVDVLDARKVAKKIEEVYTKIIQE